ncbi:hypothetical protein [Paenibacillus harenae]|uniref:hypothetical protein n=1 Tax=Paenibacillus harenae TaxID=306543 RepID=UPI00278CC575|nr:hypothetical protein [Paenibacillus harenae]MDQ0058486.1 hypothetical protein [Paenibacillus harenae]
MEDELEMKLHSQGSDATRPAKWRSNSQKALAFALMLTVPIALSGCNTASNNDCEDYDNNNYCDDDGSHIISSGKKVKKSSSIKSSSSSSKGFGSSGFGSGG